MKLVITGARGLLGLNLALEVHSLHEVVGIDRRPLRSPPFRTVEADLTVPGRIDALLDQFKPDAMIHCAAAADVDFCEANPEEAWRLNADLAGQAAAACASRGVRLVHISTDAVFDGRKEGAYSESDEPNPGGIYARTKYAAEQTVSRAYPQAIIARVNFYGWSPTGTRSLAEFFVNNLGAGRAVFGFTDVTFCPMLVNDLARLLLNMLSADLHGLFHVVGPQPMSKLDFGRAIAREFGYDEHLIAPKSVDDSGLAARRSHNLWLSIHKLSTALESSIPDFSTGMTRFHAQFEQNYPQMIRHYQQEGPSSDGDVRA